MDDDDIDALKAFMDTQQEGIYTCLPATVGAYDPTGPSVTVTPDLPKQVTDGRVIAAPALHGVTVRWFACDVGGALAQITGPLKKGDGGMLVFSQRSLDKWRQGSKKAPDDPRMHDINDAFFIPGVNANGKAPAPDATNLTIAYGPGGFRIAPSGVITVFGPGFVMAAPSTFQEPVTMTPAAPIVANGGITGSDGFDFEGHKHPVTGVQTGLSTVETGPPNAG